MNHHLIGFPKATTDGPRILITGISGFIASWLCFYCLKLGYRVRGTVRDIQDVKKYQHLFKLCPEAEGIEIMEANLISDGKDWDEAVKGCQYIFHIASPFPLEEPRNKSSLIEPAVQGTLNVLGAASRTARPPRRIVITSSITAIAYGSETEGKTFTDDDWTVVDNPAFPIPAYHESKTRAERAAWSFVSSLPPSKRFELVSINPTIVIGPLLSKNNCGSLNVAKTVLCDTFIADLQIDVVSVHDVVQAHLLSLAVPEAAGKRFLIHGAATSLLEISQFLDAELHKFKFRPTKIIPPNWAVRIVGYFDPKARMVSKLVGTKRQYDCRNAREILGLRSLDGEWKPLFLQMALSGIRFGLIPCRSRTLKANVKADQTLRSPSTKDTSSIPRALSEWDLWAEEEGCDALGMDLEGMSLGMDLVDLDALSILSSRSTLLHRILQENSTNNEGKFHQERIEDGDEDEDDESREEGREEGRGKIQSILEGEDSESTSQFVSLNSEAIVGVGLEGEREGEGEGEGEEESTDTFNSSPPIDQTSSPPSTPTLNTESNSLNLPPPSPPPPLIK